MKSTNLLVVLMLVFSSVLINVPVNAQNTKSQQKTELQTSKFKVWGNCGTCKKNIEKAVKIEGVTKADWNKDTKIITVTFDSSKITLEQIQKRIASAGYDTELFNGNDKAYNKLDKCCQYDRK
jgi:mercuric ion binding protein